MNEKQQQIINFIREYQRQHPLAGGGGLSPTYEEIRVALGMSTKSLVDHHLRALEKRGLLILEPYTPRGIKLVAGQR